MVKLKRNLDHQMGSIFGQITTKWASGLLGQTKWYTEFRSFLKNFRQCCTLKGKPDMKTRLLCEFGPEILKNVQYSICKFLIQIGNRRSTTKCDFSGKMLPFEVIWGEKIGMTSPLVHWWSDSPGLHLLDCISAHVQFDIESDMLTGV